MGVSWTATMDQRLLLVILSIVKLDAAAIAAKWQEEYGSDGSDQPTKRGITEHIFKLKKSLGMSPSKASGVRNKRSTQPNALKRSPGKRTKFISPPANGRDDTELPLSPIKKEGDTRETPNTPPPSTGGRSPTFGRSVLGTPPQGKRKHGNMSADEDSDDDASVKSEASDEYRGRSSGFPESPVRVMQPRRAKSERPVIVIDETSEDGDEGFESAVEEDQVDLTVPTPPNLAEDEVTIIT
ncbi:Hypothetical predicted protein [Lecanosticta acicola]|uniref:Uncharacterized protein n=1 Tax=Lecanosticta acicola TaxID=111012 RepID=A0AAI9ECP7_9PEZI|nr:Hypothetical predicted protein [Lecanosticta acicola]